MRKKNLIWSAVLAAGLLVTLTMNTLANALPLFGRPTGEISDNLPNLFVPAGLTFSVWGVIYLALIVFTLYQLAVIVRNPENPPEWWLRIAPWVLLSHAANSLWIVAWHALQYEISLVLMLVLFGSLLRIMLQLQWSGRTLSRGSFWAAGVPFSLYSGWITVALPANITGLLVARGVTDIPPGPVFWAAALVTAAAGLGVLAALRYRDAAYPLVISWALLGVSLARTPAEPWLSGWAAAFSLAALLAATAAVVATTTKQDKTTYTEEIT